MKKTKIMIEYVIYAANEKFKPEYVSKILGIEPSEIRYNGQVLKETENGKRVWDTDSWCIRTNYEESLDMYDQMNKLLELLKGKEELLIDLQKEYGIESCFMVVAEIWGKQIPYIDLKRSFLDYLQRIGADIRFDMYIN